MPKHTRRSDCPISYALEVFGDRWTLLIMRDLLLNRHRHFQHFLEAGEKIAPNILSERLRRLEQLQLLERSRDPADRRRLIYRPTPSGLELLPLLLELAAWGALHDPLTGAHPEFLVRFQQDREAVLGGFREAALES